MAHVLKAFVGETSTTTGTGALALAAAFVDSASGITHKRFSAVCSTSDTTEVMVRHASDGTWAHCLATYSAANELTLTTTVESSTGSAISWAAGDKYVILTPLARTYAGLHTLWVPALAMSPRTTNGPSVGTAEMTTNKNMFKTLDFDTATAEYAQFAVQMPKGWNEGTVTACFVWSHAATTTNFGVSFGLQAVAVSNDDAGDVAFGTGVLAADTGGTTNDVYVSPTTSAITIAGTPQANDHVMFQVYRSVSDGGDTMAIDARLHGVQLFYTLDAGTDD